jgi:hypothetical protein
VRWRQRYERSGIVSDAEAKAMGELAVTIQRAVVAWLGEHHPHLLSRVR